MRSTEMSLERRSSGINSPGRVNSYTFATFTAESALCGALARKVVGPCYVSWLTRS